MRMNGVREPAATGMAPADSTGGAGTGVPGGHWTRERAQEQAAKGREAWNAHDADAVLALVTEGIVWQDPSIPGGSLRGKQAAREWMTSLWRAVPDLTFESVGEPFISLDGSRFAGQWRLVGHMTGQLDPPGWAPTNGAIDVAGIDILELEGGLVSREQSFADMTVFARQIGALPAPGSFVDRVAALLQRLVARRRRARAGRAQSR